MRLMPRLPARRAAAPARPGPPGPMTQPPVIDTERLRLRGLDARDFEAFAAFFATDRARFVGGPLDRETAWKVLARVIGHWTLRGYGTFGVTLREADGPAIGMVGPWFPEGWPEPEIGWMLWDAGLEGRGYAREAAAAARDWAFRDLGWTTAVSYIHADNPRSIALAERLGARIDPASAFPDAEPCLVYRHHPARLP